MTSAAVTQQLATYTLVWSAAFLVLRFVIFRRFSATFSNVVVSWGHAVVAMLICAPAIDWAHPFSNYGGVTSPAQVRDLCALHHLRLGHGPGLLIYFLQICCTVVLCMLTI